MANREELITEAMELHRKLFNIANAFALSKEGNTAVLLHAACNDILRAKKCLEGNLPDITINSIISHETMVNSVLFEGSLGEVE